MNKTQTPAPSALYSAWTEAYKAKDTFYRAHTGAWTDAVGVEYRRLNGIQESLFVKYMSAKTGKSIGQVAGEINESMHSRFD